MVKPQLSVANMPRADSAMPYKSHSWKDTKMAWAISGPLKNEVTGICRDLELQHPKKKIPKMIDKKIISIKLVTIFCDELDAC